MEACMEKWHNYNAINTEVMSICLAEIKIKTNTTKKIGVYMEASKPK